MRSGKICSNQQYSNIVHNEYHFCLSYRGECPGVVMVVAVVFLTGVFVYYFDLQNFLFPKVERHIIGLTQTRSRRKFLS